MSQLIVRCFIFFFFQLSPVSLHVSFVGLDGKSFISRTWVPELNVAYFDITVVCQPLQMGVWLNLLICINGLWLTGLIACKYQLAICTTLFHQSRPRGLGKAAPDYNSPVKSHGIHDWVASAGLFKMVLPQPLAKSNQLSNNWCQLWHFPLKCVTVYGQILFIYLTAVQVSDFLG